MAESSPPIESPNAMTGMLWVAGAALGGTSMAILSSIGTYALEKQQPTLKTVVRDFLLGAVLFLMIQQLLPESTSRLLTWIAPFLVSVPLGALATVATGDAAVSDELEVKVGVPRF
jgi:zinc transporter ZupT